MDKIKEVEFTGLMEKHKGIIFKVVNSYCQEHDERQDLAQEILTAMWLSIDKYNNEFKFSTWMYRIALNVAISYYRKDSKRQDRPSATEELMINITYISIEDGEKEEIKQLYRFIGELDKLNKAIIILYLESESYESIANSLGLSKTNVATRIGRIKVLLANKFKD